MEQENKEVQNLGELFFHAAKKYDKEVAMRKRDYILQEWVDVTWHEFEKKVEELAAKLLEFEIEKGDKVAILSNSRLEWGIIDIANFSVGAVTVPIYQSNLPEEVEYVLKHSEAKLVFVEDREQLAKVLEVRSELPILKHIILIEGKVKTPGFIIGYDSLFESGKQILAKTPNIVKDRTFKVKTEDIASIVYTSGTTGPPKGVLLTHGNFLFELDSLSKVLPVNESDETLLFLPLAHIFARIGFLAFLKKGFIVSFAESIDRLMDNMLEIRPTFLFSVPRIYGKVYNTIISGVSRSNRLSKQIFSFSMSIGRSVSKLKQNNKWIPPHLDFSNQVAELLVFNKLKKRFGGKLRFFISGGAPLSKEIAEFFHAAGIMILEGYGLTENVAAATLNTLDNYKFGTVGKLIPGVEVDFAEDGEILLKGKNIFKGYFKNEEATKESIDNDWFHTGDIGVIDNKGFLKITDRKKDLIVTSAGKNIAPQNIENLMKTTPILSQIMVYGDKRNYLTAIVTLNQDEVTIYADSKNIDYNEYKELLSHKLIINKVEREIQKKNKKLASYETIKKFRIIENEFEIGEELTPTLKVKRKVTIDKYIKVLDSMYDK